MRVIIAQTIFLGDLLLTLPLVQKLKSTFPDAEVDMLVNARYANVLQNNPIISHVLPFDKENEHRGSTGVRMIIRELKKRRYDIAIVLPGSIRTALAVFLAGIPRRIGSDQSTGMIMWKDVVKFPKELRSSHESKVVSWGETVWKFVGGAHSFVSMLFTDVVPFDPHVHAAERYSRLLRPLGVKEDRVELPKLFPSPEDKRAVDDILARGESTKTLVGVAPGSVWKTKRWQQESFAEVMRKLSERIQNVAFMLIGGSEDREVCATVQSLSRAVNILNTSGQLTPLQSAELLRRCSVLLTNDSAAMHLASAVGTRCIVIFGPTIPEFGFRPLGEGHSVIEQKGLSCRPCTPHGGHRCPLGTHECMKNISVEEVVHVALSTIEKQ